jgi:2-keto-3-deoxy-galactonokinase
MKNLKYEFHRALSGLCAQHVQEREDVLRGTEGKREVPAVNNLKYEFHCALPGVRTQHDQGFEDVLRGAKGKVIDVHTVTNFTVHSLEYV